MSESEGLAKLTEYLKQTRRQAEIAIDNLNSQLVEVKKENDTIRASVNLLQREREEQAAIIRQLKAETGNKSKFKERDEWKALVENIQKDRDRLQLEYNHVVSLLDEANIEIARTKQDLAMVTDEYRALSEQQQQQTRPFSPASPSLETKNEMMLSPVFDRHGNNLFEEPPASPRSMALRLKQELRKTNEQATEELAWAEQELNMKDMQIRRLENELREQQLRIQNDGMISGTLFARSSSTDDLSIWRGHTTVLAETIEMKREDTFFSVLFSFFNYQDKPAEVENTSPAIRLLKV